MRGFPKHPIPFEPVWLRGFVEDVHDGDTYHINIALAYNCEVTVSVRLYGVNCPELSTEKGKEAAAKIRALIEGKPVLVRSYRDRQSFSRWVAEVQFLADPVQGIWEDLSEWIVDHGLGVRMYEQR